MEKSAKEAGGALLLAPLFGTLQLTAPAFQLTAMSRSCGRGLLPDKARVRVRVHCHDDLVCWLGEISAGLG
jgi:hypothetical protein